MSTSVLEDTTVNHSSHHYAHHYANAGEEFEAAKQGMWVFLVTEILMFGGLFVAYGVFRGMYPEMYHAAHRHLDIRMGAANTLILIASSLTMALAVSASQRGHKRSASGFLGITIACAVAFLVIKYFEYAQKFHHGLLPGSHFTNAELLKDYPKAPLFFSLYFMMTGLHGIHILIGIGLIGWMWRRSARGDFGPEFYTPIELTGFYWHFVDLVWIYLFPLLYLVG